MATAKSWTAYDVQMGKLSIIQRGTDIALERRYVFVDDTDTVMPDIAGGRLARLIPWSSIPASVQAALLVIDDWCYNQILAQEGME